MMIFPKYFLIEFVLLFNLVLLVAEDGAFNVTTDNKSEQSEDGKGALNSVSKNEESEESEDEGCISEESEAENGAFTEFQNKESEQSESEDEGYISEESEAGEDSFNMQTNNKSEQLEAEEEVLDLSSDDKSMISEAENDAFNASTDDKAAQLKAENMLKNTLIEIRKKHIEAVNHLRTSMKYEKQYKLAVEVFEKVFAILKTSKAIIENSDYVPTGSFPLNETLIEVIGQTLDSTALYGEFQLKLPEISDRIMKNRNDWMALVKWGISFSNLTGFYDPQTVRMMDLLCQELNLTQRTENYTNPYRIEKPKTQQSEEKKTAKKKKIFKKGPRMTKPHLEL